MTSVKMMDGQASICFVESGWVQYAETQFFWQSFGPQVSSSILFVEFDGVDWQAMRMIPTDPDSKDFLQI